MEEKKEYHDPDYPEVPVKDETQKLSEEEKLEKVKQIVRREFCNEIEAREKEVTLLDQRMSTARRYLQQLRYTLVNNYYKDQKLQLTSAQISDEIAAQSEPRAKANVAHLLRDGQRRLHPSVRKLLGKETTNLEEIFKFKGPRNNSRKDYTAMVAKRNYTISADSTKTLRPETRTPDPIEMPETSKPKKIPRHIEPRIENVVTLDEVTRNKMKQKYRIIIGNTSKYAPPASKMDKSTHKWLLYIRGPAEQPDLSSIVSSVTARLHHSYAPHHIVHLRKPPFHISRRGWGEFPVKLELHFPLPAMNRPATLTHTIKLDRHYTGLQTLGAETIVDVWLYSTPEMLPFEYKDTQNEINTQENNTTQTQENNTDTDKHTNNTETQIKQEPRDEQNDWLDFFEKQKAVSVDDMIVKDMKKEPEIIENHIEEKDKEPLPMENIKQPWKKRIMKYMDQKTGKIYYFEMDRKLDLSTVQEVVINSKGNVQKVKISPVKSNGVKKIRKTKPEVLEDNLDRLSHIENDHCYLGFNFYENRKKYTPFEDFKKTMTRFRNIRQTVTYLLKKIPLISGEVRNSDFLKCFPFVVESDEKYWKLDFAKRRNIEWSRAKLINRLLLETCDTEPIWRTKQILTFARLHGFYPIRPENTMSPAEIETEEWSSWNDIENTRKLESNIRELYPNASDITSLSIFDSDRFKVTDEVMVSDSDEEIDIVSDKKVKVKRVSDNKVSLSPLPVDSEDRLRFLFIERQCSDIGIELRNEEVGHGFSYSAVHAVILSAMKSFAEELIRESLAVKLMEGSSDQPPPTWSGSSRSTIQLEHVWGAARRLPALSRTALATTRKHTHAV